MSILNSSIDFKNPKGFLRKYNNVEVEKGYPKDLAVFPIMDTDDCDDKTKQSYMDRSLFKEHWMHDFITPIYNTPSLEDVMVFCKLINKKLSDNEKVPTYQKLFPITSNGTNYDEIIALRDCLAKCPNTNFDVLIDHCLKLADEVKVRC